MNHCTRCEQLEEEIAYLKGERKDADRETELSRLCDATGLSRGGALIVHELYRAGGRVVAAWVLAENFNTERNEGEIVSVYICRIRKALGFSAIITARSRGYRLAPVTLPIIAGIISGEARDRVVIPFRRDEG